MRNAMVLKPEKENSKIKIRDNGLFLYVYPIFALLAVHIGNDNSFQQLLGMPSYYTDVLFALLCAFGFGFYIRWVSSTLYKKIGWKGKTSTLIQYQTVFGLLLPCLFIVLLEIIYLHFLVIPLRESPILYLEFPLIVLLGLLINIIYLFLYYRAHNMQVQKMEGGLQKKHFAAKEGHRIVNVSIDDLAYFVKRGKYTFLMTKNGKDYLYDHSFKVIKEVLPPKLFFQINRQIIAQRDSIVSCSKTETRRLKIIFSPKMEGPVHVAKVNVTKFLSWLNNP
ncbi:MAG: LytTR family DNA-binding domain-containing protein [Bacteroidota bacterium]